MIKGKKWSIFSDDNLVKEMLLDIGGVIQQNKNEKASLLWVVKIGNSNFSMYDNGTLFSYPSNDENLNTIRKQISEKFGTSYQFPDQDVLIGIDETGVGEMLGDLVLSIVSYPKKLHNELESILSVSDTKNKRSFSYWDNLYSELKPYLNKEIICTTEIISYSTLGRLSPHKIMNIVYPIMLKNFIQNLNSTKCSIVIDDYGIDEKFKTLLSELKNQQYQIKVENGADERHLEVKLASVLAKYERMRLLSVYDKKYSLEGNGIGSGHIEDEVTKKWIRLWKKTKRPWPDFVKKWLIQ